MPLAATHSSGHLQERGAHSAASAAKPAAAAVAAAVAASSLAVVAAGEQLGVAAAADAVAAAGVAAAGEGERDKQGRCLLRARGSEWCALVTMGQLSVSLHAEVVGSKRHPLLTSHRQKTCVFFSPMQSWLLEYS